MERTCCAFAHFIEMSKFVEMPIVGHPPPPSHGGFLSPHLLTSAFFRLLISFLNDVIKLAQTRPSDLKIDYDVRDYLNDIFQLYNKEASRASVLGVPKLLNDSLFRNIN